MFHRKFTNTLMRVWMSHKLTREKVKGHSVRIKVDFLNTDIKLVSFILVSKINREGSPENYNENVHRSK